MTTAAPSTPTRAAADLRPWIRWVRLVTGLVLLTYVLSHLVNHALGLWSLDALEMGRGWFLAAWRNPAATVLLYGSLAIHYLLALWALYHHRRLTRIRPAEALQLVLGFATIPLLADHVLTTRLYHQLFATEDSYTYVLLALWADGGQTAALQSLALVVAWLHGWLGLHLWLRLKPWYLRAYPYLMSAALLVPILSLLGFVQGGRAVAAIRSDPRRLVTTMMEIGWPDRAAVDFAARAEMQILIAWLAILILILLARGWRDWRGRHHRAIELTFPGGVRVEVPKGASILEASQSADLPHAAVCGGRGRCSTCRVRIGASAGPVPAPSAEELRVLKRIAAPPNVRLACQLRPTANLEVVPLLPPSARPKDGFARPPLLAGEEREIAVLFADLRGFTTMAERRLPYDVVFIMNQYFEALGRAIVESGGQIDKFTGDGVMALFGVDKGPAAGCRQALAAATAIAEGLARLNQTLRSDLREPLKVGIGVHAGPAIIGEMGFGAATAVTAVGDTVNAASRLEALTKTHACQLIVSDAAARHADIDLSALPSAEFTLRGRRQPMQVRLIDTVDRLASCSKASDAGR